MNSEVLKRTGLWPTPLIEIIYLISFFNDCGIFLIKSIVQCQVRDWGFRDQLSCLGVTNHSYWLMLGMRNYLQERGS